jgi:hypothetical protein
VRRGRQFDLEGLSGAEADQRVLERRARGAAVLVFDDVGAPFDGHAVDGEQDVAALQAGAGGRRPVGYLGHHDALGPIGPEDAVLDLMGLGAERDVRDTEHEQHADNRQGKE